MEGLSDILAEQIPDHSRVSTSRVTAKSLTSELRPSSGCQRVVRKWRRESCQWGMSMPKVALTLVLSRTE